MQQTVGVTDEPKRLIPYDPLLAVALFIATMAMWFGAGYVMQGRVGTGIAVCVVPFLTVVPAAILLRRKRK